MDEKLKHLEFIQAVIARMANASFLFKGWSISISGALFAFAVVNDTRALVAMAVVATLLFWGLDAYYLWLERSYIALYAKVASTPIAAVDFSMAVDKQAGFRRWMRTCIRFHLVLFYGSMLALELIGVLAMEGGCRGS